MTMRHAILSLVTIGAFLALPAWGLEQSVEEMKKKADEVLKLDNVASRTKIDVVMQLADRLKQNGNLPEAARYYEAGLRRVPTDLKSQLACAELYLMMGKKDEALTKAKIVAKAAEEDSLIVPARRMLGETVDTAVEPMGKLDGDAFTIVLVPMGDVDVLLLRDIRQRLQDKLGITILIRTIPLEMPKCGRLSSLEKQWNVDDLLKVLSEAKKPYEQKNLRFVGVTNCDIYDKDTSFLFASGYLNRFMVMSYNRFTSAFTHELPNRGRLLKRATNQALSSCGKVFGIDSCSDPTCPRAYPNSVDEHDAKSEELCDNCKNAFDKAFERKAMPASTSSSAPATD
jgi:predicted Zn-dependent protease